MSIKKHQKATQKLTFASLKMLTIILNKGNICFQIRMSIIKHHSLKETEMFYTK